MSFYFYHILIGIIIGIKCSGLAWCGVSPLLSWQSHGGSGKDQKFKANQGCIVGERKGRGGKGRAQ